MKTIFTFLSLGVFALVLYSCGSSKNAEMQAFKEVPYYVVERGEGRELSDIRLFIPVKELPQQQVQLDSVYFLGRKAALVPSTEDKVFMAVFPDAGRSGKMVMHIDPRKEFGNKVPVLTEKIPYELAEDEAVIIFYKNGRRGEYKLEGILRRE